MMVALPSRPTFPHHVLIVDDSAGVRRAVQASLSPHMQVTVVESVPEALAALTPSVGLVLSDIRMPGESGFDLASRLRRDHPTLPVLLFTGVVDHETRAQAHAVGVDTVLRKPLTKEVLLKAVHEYLGNPEPAPAKTPAPAVVAPALTARPSPVAGTARPGPPAPASHLDPLADICQQPGVLSAVHLSEDGTVDRAWNLPLPADMLDVLNLLACNVRELAEGLGASVLDGHLFPFELSDRVILLGFVEGKTLAFVVRNTVVAQQVSHLVSVLGS